jgi:hypothetical protein
VNRRRHETSAGRFLEQERSAVEPERAREQREKGLGRR